MVQVIKIKVKDWHVILLGEYHDEHKDFKRNQAKVLFINNIINEMQKRGNCVDLFMESHLNNTHAILKRPPDMYKDPVQHSFNTLRDTLQSTDENETIDKMKLRVHNVDVRVYPRNMIIQTNDNDSIPFIPLGYGFFNKLLIYRFNHLWLSNTMWDYVRSEKQNVVELATKLKYKEVHAIAYHAASAAIEVTQRIFKEWLKLDKDVGPYITPDQLKIFGTHSWAATTWMDLYTLYRMLVSYDADKPNPKDSSCRMYNKYILFYAGAAHTQHLKLYLEQVAVAINDHAEVKVYKDTDPGRVQQEKIDINDLITSWEN